jgi:hypothetical protein
MTRPKHDVLGPDLGGRCRQGGHRPACPVVPQIFARVSETERRTLHRLLLTVLGEPTDVLDERDGLG